MGWRIRWGGIVKLDDAGTEGLAEDPASCLGLGGSGRSVKNEKRCIKLGPS